MYVIQNQPDVHAFWETSTGHVSKATPRATLAGQYGGRAHILMDDHCYVLLLQQNNGNCKPISWWFKEAAFALYQLIKEERLRDILR